MKDGRYFSERKCAMVYLLSIIIIFSAALANGSEEITGSWIFKGTMYAYTFTFNADGTAERTMNLDSMTVWSGSGKYTLHSKNLTVKLDNTASNTVHTEMYTIKKLSSSALTLGCAGEYFNDIKSKDITMVRKK